MAREQRSDRSMIFHHPFPMPTEAASGSRVRLTRMAEAFRQVGYEVHLVAGHAGERKRIIAQLKREIEGGLDCDFVYSESSAVPTAFSKRNIGRPALDFQFFNWCRRQSIPVGLYYRDVHWRFEQFQTQAPSWLRRTAAIPLYWYDWTNYRRTVDHLFLPSLAMASALPGRWPEDRLSALFPGCSPSNSDRIAEPSPEHLELFYVGGVMPPLYDLKPTFDALHGLDNVHLTVCCRRPEWLRTRAHYEPLNDAKVRIVHAHGRKLETFYGQADLFALLWRPNPYLEFAMPVKLFESLGHAVPLVTTEGTEVARFVQQEELGWVVADKDGLTQLLRLLRASPHLIADKRRHLQEVRTRHTWQARAQEAAEILTPLASSVRGAQPGRQKRAGGA